MVLGLAACGSRGGSSASGSGSGSGGDSTTVANKDKPVVWYNRQPSNSSTGELDMNALQFNDKTYYVGFDANQGAELQGQMIKEYLEKAIKDLSLIHIYYRQIDPPTPYTLGCVHDCAQSQDDQP